MKRIFRFGLLAASLALLGAVLMPISAQDASMAGQGGTIVDANIGDDPSTFNPIDASDASSSAVWDWLYPAIIALDDKTLEETPGASDGLAESWSYDETGTILTIKLREGLTWSDGTPITAQDYIWSLDAVRSGVTSSPRTYVFYQLADGSVSGGSVFEYKAIDDYTLEIKLGQAVTDEAGEWTGEVVASCTALSDLNDIAPVPAHVFGPKYGEDYSSMQDDPYFVGPTFGVFTDPYLEFGVQVSLLADQTYPDTQLGYVAPGEWIYRQVDNTNVMYERFLAGDFTAITVPPNKVAEFRALNESLPEGEKYQVIEYPRNGYIYMGYNVADPKNPQNGSDENGNPIDQGIHPIFGDVRVRQAIAYAVDLNALIGTKGENGQPGTGILQGNGVTVPTHNHPGLSWVDPGLDVYPFDVEKTAALLDETGWTDENGDGVRECTSCLYAEKDPSFIGSPLQFTLYTNAGNLIREAYGESIKVALEQVGFIVDFQAIEFGTMLDRMDAQDYDAIIIGWSLGLPFDPDSSSFFGIGQDIVGSGFNAGSYYNPELEKLWEEARTLPGCDKEARAEIYKETMKILWEEQPYLWLYADPTVIAAQPNVENFDPLPYNASWNLDAWTIK